MEESAGMAYLIEEDGWMPGMSLRLSSVDFWRTTRSCK